jgi:hypothetical protein
LVLALAVTGMIALVAGAAVGAGPAGGAPRASAQAVPHVNHVFIIVLENENADSTFGPDTAAPYLAHTLRSRGAFLPNYYAIGHESLDNYIAMVSGQAPNTQTQADCMVYTNFKPGTPTSNGQYRGTGCVYPAPVATIANQLEASGHTWKGYMDGMNGKAPPGADIRCRHPAINTQDNTQTAEVGDQYAARHNPFVYFHSIIDSPTCTQHDVGYVHLSDDLRSKQTTPNYSFITPNLCHDGHDSPCVSGEPGGLETADEWLAHNVPQILRSPAFGDRGLLIVTFDEAEGDGSDADSSACCNEQPGPNTINPGALTIGPGGGKVGAVALSPCITPGTTVQAAYNHYSLLRWVEDNFDLPHLGFARQQTGVNPFDSHLLNDATCTPD